MTNNNKSSETTLQGSELGWEALEPWPDPVSGSQLLDDISKAFSRYLVLPIGAADAIALWILYTWAFDAFSVSPILAITSPTKRCGKTTVVMLLQVLASRAIAATSITPAGLFRFIESEQPTLIVDEADRFLVKSEELAGILNAGYTKATARVIRISGDNYEPRSFSTWSPKAIALIGKLPDTLQDRSIEIRMRRKMNDETRLSFRADRVPQDLEDLRSRAARWTQDASGALGDADPSMPISLHDRAQDNWRPLFAIAEVAGDEWPPRVRTAAEQLGGDADDDEEVGLQLLSDIRRALREDRVRTEELVQRLQDNKERPWNEWINGPREMARLLKPFGIKSQKIRFGKDTLRGYLRVDFLDAFERYLPGEAEQAEHPEQTLEQTETAACLIEGHDGA